MDFKEEIKAYLTELIDVINKLNVEEINRTMNTILQKYDEEATIYIFGNGGSAATASHYVCDFNKGVSLEQKKKFRFICLNDNVPTVMAIANDLSYDDIFSVQLEGKVKKEDLIIAISGSGNSKNVINGVKKAKEAGSKIVGVTGYDGGTLKTLSDDYLHVNIKDMQKVEDVHMIFDHLMMKIFCNYLGA